MIADREASGRWPNISSSKTSHPFEVYLEYKVFHQDSDELRFKSLSIWIPTRLTDATAELISYPRWFTQKVIPGYKNNAMEKGKANKV